MALKTRVYLKFFTLLLGVCFFSLFTGEDDSDYDYVTPTTGYTEYTDYSLEYEFDSMPSYDNSKK